MLRSAGLTWVRDKSEKFERTLILGNFNLSGFGPLEDRARRFCFYTDQEPESTFKSLKMGITIPLKVFNEKGNKRQTGDWICRRKEAMMMRRRKSSQTDLIDSCPGNESVLKDLKLLSWLMEMCVYVCDCVHVSGQLEPCGSPHSRKPAVPEGAQMWADVSTPAAVLPRHRRRFLPFTSRPPN